MSALNMEYVIESTANNLDIIQWFQTDHDQIRSLYNYAYDDILLERVKLETFYRKNKVMIDSLTESITNQQGGVLIGEGLMKDLGVDLSIMAGTSAKVLSAVPLLGQAIAAGGTLYYTVRAINAWRKGEKLTAFFETLSAAMTAGTVIGPVGAALSAIGNLLLKPFKVFFGLFKAEGLIGKFFANFFKKGPAAEKIVAETAETVAKAPAAAKAADGAMKFSDKIDDIVKFFETPAGKEIASKIPGFEIYLSLLQKLKSMLGFFGKFTKSAIKVEGKAASEITEELAKHSDDALKLAGEVGDEGLETVIKTAQKSFDDAAEAAVKAERELATVGSKQAKVASQLKNATRVQQELRVALDPKRINLLRQNVLDDIGRLAAESGENIAKRASQELPDAFKAIKPDKMAAWLKGIENFSGMRAGMTKALKNTNPELAAKVAKMSSEEFASFAAKQFCGNGSKVVMKKMVSKGGTKAGEVGFEIVGKNGAKFTMDMADIGLVFGREGGAKIISNILGQTTRKALEKEAIALAKEAAELTKTLGLADEAAKAAQKSLEELISNPKALQKLTTEVIEEVGPEAAKNVEKIIAPVASGGSRAAAGTSKKIVEEVTETYFRNIKSKLINRIIAYASPSLDKSDFEELESGDQDYLRTDAERNNQSSDTEIIRPSSGGSGRGLRENYMLEDIIMYSKINSSRIRSQKLINLIN